MSLRLTIPTYMLQTEVTKIIETETYENETRNIENEHKSMEKINTYAQTGHKKRIEMGQNIMMNNYNFERIDKYIRVVITANR